MPFKLNSEPNERVTRQTLVTARVDLVAEQESRRARRSATSEPARNRDRGVYFEAMGFAFNTHFCRDAFDCTEQDVVWSSGPLVRSPTALNEFVLLAVRSAEATHFHLNVEGKTEEVETGSEVGGRTGDAHTHAFGIGHGAE